MLKNIFKMKKLLIVLIGIVLFNSCSMQQYIIDTSTEFVVQEPENFFIIEKNYDYTWAKLIEFVSYLNVPLNTLSKESGVIITDEAFKWSVGLTRNNYYISQKLKQYHVFNGTEFSENDVDYGYVLARVSILVKSIGNKTKVTINDTGRTHYLEYYVYQRGLVPIESNVKFFNSGKFKQDLYNYILNE